MKVIIAEKPSLAKSVANTIDKNFKMRKGFIQCNNNTVVTWAVGHLLELKNPSEYDPELKKWDLSQLPIYFENWQLKPIESKKEQVQIIKDLLSNANEVIHCGDPDEEGQLLIDELIEFFDYRKPVKRLLINDENEEVIRKSLNNLEDNKKYMPLGRSANARRLGDIIVGINCTRYFTLKNNAGVVNIGRVKTPLLNLIVSRDNTIESHKKIIHYTLDFNIQIEKEAQDEDVGKYNKHKENIVKLLRNKDIEFLEESSKDIECKNHIFKFVPSPECYDKMILERKIVESIRDSNQKAKVLLKVEKALQTEEAPLPFNLVKLQIHCSKKFGYSPDETLNITQSLREKHKAITYNRSDCQYLNDEHYEEKDQVLNFINKFVEFDKSNISLDKKPSCFNSNYVTAHHGIIPSINKNTKLENMTEEEKNVFLEICKFYLIQFYDSCIKEKVEIQGNLENNKDKVKASQVRIIQYGFKDILGENKERNLDYSLFAYKQGTYSGEVLDIDIKENETNPPKRYTYESLLKDMVSIAKYCETDIKEILLEKDKHKEGENGSIGTPATRSSIIKSLITGGYIEEKGKSLISTQKGRDLIKILPNILTKPDMTAKWYLIQQEIIESKISEKKLVEEALNLVTEILKSNYEKMSFTSNKKTVNDEEILGICPSCSGNVYETPKAFTCKKCGKALFKEQKFYKSKITKTIIKKLLKGKECNLKNLDGIEVKRKLNFNDKYYTLNYPK